MTEEKRIYCVVAQTVQVPLIPQVLEQTKSISQPPGRLAAQVGHAVSILREEMFKKQLLTRIKKGKKKYSVTLKKELSKEFKPITTIVLGARDSFELNHVLNLLLIVGIETHPFYDTDQPDYGNPDLKVMTAIATEPVTKEDVIGILDYLPLWEPQPKR